MAEREAALKTIGEKEKKRDSLLKTYKEKFTEYVQKREERAAAQAELMRQKIAKVGEDGALSEADNAKLEGYRKNDEALAAKDKRQADAYKHDAADLQKDIDALKNRLDKGTN